MSLTRATHIIGSRSATHTLELYLDLICPFSQKQLAGVRDSVIPLIHDGKLDLKIVLRQIVQPWHSSSTLVHEAALGVAAVLAAGAGAYAGGSACARRLSRLARARLARFYRATELTLNSQVTAMTNLKSWRSRRPSSSN